MSPAMSALTSIGITNNMLILAVLALVAAGVIGMYWQIIVPGAIVVVIGSLFINFTPSENTKTEVKVDAKQVEVFDEHAAYMKDCMEVAEYKMYECENLWNGRKTGESSNDSKVTPVKVDKTDTSELQLIDVDNAEYKARRDAALQKPGAVIGHVTYR